MKIFGEEDINRLYGKRSAADFDPFEGVETYSMKYTRKKRTVPDLGGRAFSVFPFSSVSALEQKDDGRSGADMS